jgi:hypothetical protein
MTEDRSIVAGGVESVAKIEKERARVPVEGTGAVNGWGFAGDG